MFLAVDFFPCQYLDFYKGDHCFLYIPCWQPGFVTLNMDFIIPYAYPSGHRTTTQQLQQQRKRRDYQTSDAKASPTSRSAADQQSSQQHIAKHANTRRTKPRHQLTIFLCHELVLEADSLYEKWMESLSNCSTSRECVTNMIIPTQSHPQAALLLADCAAYEMLH